MPNMDCNRCNNSFPDEELENGACPECDNVLVARQPRNRTEPSVSANNIERQSYFEYIQRYMSDARTSSNDNIVLGVDSSSSNDSSESVDEPIQSNEQNTESTAVENETTSESPIPQGHTITYRFNTNRDGISGHNNREIFDYTYVSPYTNSYNYVRGTRPENSSPPQSEESNNRNNNITTNLERFLDIVERARNTSMQIFNDGTPRNHNGFVVVNGSNAYNVLVRDNQISGCTCPDHIHRGTVCKHMVKVSLEKNLNISQLGRPVNNNSRTREEEIDSIS